MTINLQNNEANNKDDSEDKSNAFDSKTREEYGMHWRIDKY
jgi:hypothetical protein